MNYLIAVLQIALRQKKPIQPWRKKAYPWIKLPFWVKGTKVPMNLGSLTPIYKRRSKSITSILADSVWICGGYAFNLQTRIELFEWAGSWGTTLLAEYLARSQVPWVVFCRDWRWLDNRQW
jgi:hypothetical protein